MSYRSGLLTGIISTALVAGAAGAAWWAFAAKKSDSAKSDAHGTPATVPKPFKEDSAATVVLPADSEARLALRTSPIVRKPMPRKRVFGGEVVLPPGRSIIVSAPLAGTLKPSSAPMAGQVVKAGKPVLQLVPVIDPVGRANLTAGRVDAEGQVKTAEEQVKVARITLDRAKEVLAGGAGRQRDVDEATATLKVAEQTLAAANARRDLLARVLGELDSGTATPIPIEAPADGVLRNVNALPGQTVPSGAPLFEVVNLEVVWIRVPVYVGDREEIADKPASIGGLGAPVRNVGRPAFPVPAPPAANPAAGTVDLYFYTVNPDLNNDRWGAAVGAFGGIAIAPFVGTPFSPGERVAVSLTLKEPAEVLTVPWSAVVYDYFGGAWVYVKTAERTYSRQRVLVRCVIGETAVLDDGPLPGTQVVTAGAAELFGAETGFSK